MKPPGDAPAADGSAHIEVAGHRGAVPAPRTEALPAQPVVEPAPDHGEAVATGPDEESTAGPVRDAEDGTAAPVRERAAGPAVAALTEREREILAFERRWWKHAGAKEQAIRDAFDLSATRYYQLLNGLLDNPAALAAEPMLVGRLRRLRASRSRTRRR